MKKENVNDLATMANQIGRSAIAVVDTMTQRGAVKGEELSTIGQLRDQCARMVQVAETVLNELAEVPDEGED